jgi:hypothetical protein
MNSKMLLVILMVLLVLSSSPSALASSSPVEVQEPQQSALYTAEVGFTPSSATRVQDQAGRLRMNLPHGGWIEWPSSVRQGEVTYFSLYLTTESSDRNVRIKRVTPQRCFLGICYSSYLSFNPQLVSCVWPRDGRACLRQITVSVARDTPSGTYTVYSEDRWCPGVCGGWDPFQFQITVVRR